MSGSQPPGDSGVYAGIELGGTKVVCGVGHADGALLARASIPTRGPEETLADIGALLDRWAGEFGGPEAVGLATFGPVYVASGTRTYGTIGPSPKTLWQGVDLIHEFRALVDVPSAIQTDVNGAALGEATWGAGRGVDPLVYITVGTGIGGGAVVNGQPTTGVLHPEMGHIYVPRAEGDDWPGSCTRHLDCVEGMAAGPSVVGRWGERLSELPHDHEAYRLLSHYIGHLVHAAVLLLAPRRVILGGGVMSNLALFPLVRAQVQELLGGFFPAPEVLTGIDEYIVPPALGGDAGVKGAIALALRAAGRDPVIAGADSAAMA